MEPPVPIPNTEVKRFSADDTEGATPWENTPLPGGIFFSPSSPQPVIASHSPSRARRRRSNLKGSFQPPNPDSWGNIKELGGIPHPEASLRPNPRHPPEAGCPSAHPWGTKQSSLPSNGRGPEPASDFDPGVRVREHTRPRQERHLLHLPSTSHSRFGARMAR